MQASEKAKRRTADRFTVRLKARGSDKEMGMSGRMLAHPKGKVSLLSGLVLFCGFLPSCFGFWNLDGIFYIFVVFLLLCNSVYS